MTSTRSEQPLQWGQAQAEFERLVAIAIDECVLWPYAKDTNGYGRIWSGSLRRTQATHVRSCEKAHGSRPTSLDQAAHSCGTPGCINGRHLRWATPKENMSDRLLHGTHGRGEQNTQAVLTAFDVLEIRRLCREGRPHAGIATRFGVTKRTIRSISRGENWGWLS